MNNTDVERQLFFCNIKKPYNIMRTTSFMTGCDDRRKWIPLVFITPYMCYSFLVVSHDSIRGCVRLSVGWSVGPSVRRSVMLLSRRAERSRRTCITTCSWMSCFVHLDKSRSTSPNCDGWQSNILSVILYRHPCGSIIISCSAGHREQVAFIKCRVFFSVESGDTCT